MSAVVEARPVRRGGRRVLLRPRRPWWVLVLTVVLLTWGLSAAHVDTEHLGPWGFLGAVPAAWYAAAGTTLVWTARELVARVFSAPAAAAALGCLVVLLYATPAVTEDVARYPWVYKHIAVTQYFAGGASEPVVRDIYQRWPGFFTTSAFLGAAAGVPDPTGYAAWAELLFAAVDVVLVIALARRFTTRARLVWLTAVLYTAGNWVGQNYYAPQAFAYTLALALVLVVLSCLGGTPNALGRRVVRLVERVLRAPAGPVGEPGPAPAPRSVTVAAVLVVVLAHLLITSSHQLTPYVLLLGLVPLGLTGWVRPWWLPLLMTGVTLAWLVPNLDYVQSRFGILSGFDPFANATAAAVATTPTTTVDRWQAVAVLVLTAIGYLLAAAGLVRRARSGHARSAVLVGWLAFAPSLTLAGQAYGGEGRFRVVLFSVAWTAIAAAWLVDPGRRPPGVQVGPVPETAPGRRRTAWTAALVLVVTTLGLAVQMQPEARNHVAAADVDTARWVQQHAGPSDVVLLWDGSFFPLSPIGVGAGLGGLASLAEEKQWFPQDLTAVELLEIATAQVPTGVHDTYVVFSPSMTASCPSSCRFAPGEEERLERSLPAAGYRLVHSDGDVRVYRD